MVGRTNAGGGGRKKEPIIPLFSGAYNFVTSDNGQSGYIEIFGSGPLSWSKGVIPETVDITCVGAGGGGGNAWGQYYAYIPEYDFYADAHVAGPGGGGGYVNTVTGVELPEIIDITVGAGGTSQATGGTTSVGTICVANGGTGGRLIARNSEYGTFYDSAAAGGGGNYGGLGFSSRYEGGSGFSENAAYANGGSNGASFPSVSTLKGNIAGTSQGTPTVDILGRVHAGGGAAGTYGTAYGSSYTKRFSGGASDFTNGKGSTAADIDQKHMGSSYHFRANGGDGGGGYGGGGGGGCLCVNYSGQYANDYTTAGARGGDGFVIIGWGDYKSLFSA